MNTEVETVVSEDKITNYNIDRAKQIHEKGFDMTDIEFGKVKIGNKILDNAIIDIVDNLTNVSNRRPRYYPKGRILQALHQMDLSYLREVSEYFYKTNGIYQRACNYLAQLYRYDWFIAPEIFSEEETKNEAKITKEFIKILNYLDNSHIKELCSNIMLQVIKYGAYYGYIIENGNGFMLQELPANYCRARYSIGTSPAVEFNMRFFDDKFPEPSYRERVLKMFPKDFQKGYKLYKEGKLIAETFYESAGWYLLEPGYAVKFAFSNGDIPVLINTIPYILDLEDAQELDRKKQLQQLLKIIVQKLPLDKNGDLIFDLDEAQDLHHNIVMMLRNAVGVDVLTTFGDIDSIDISDTNTTTKTDDLEKVERAVFNAMGISQNLFNTSGNMALEKSILNDESYIRPMIMQLSAFFDRLCQLRSTASKKYCFRFNMLETTQHNYKELSKMYKEQVQIGYSKMLPQIALGHSQSSIINNVYFENSVLHLNELMIPPLMSSTMSSEDVLGNRGQSNGSKTQTAQTEEKESGRPELPDDQKSEKTIQNKESMS